MVTTVLVEIAAGLLSCFCAAAAATMAADPVSLAETTAAAGLLFCFCAAAVVSAAVAQTTAAAARIPAAANRY